MIVTSNKIIIIIIIIKIIQVIINIIRVINIIVSKVNSGINADKHFYAN